MPAIISQPLEKGRRRQIVHGASGMAIDAETPDSFSQRFAGDEAFVGEAGSAATTICPAVDLKESAERLPCVAASKSVCSQRDESRASK